VANVKTHEGSAKGVKAHGVYPNKGRLKHTRETRRRTKPVVVKGLDLFRKSMRTGMPGANSHVMLLGLKTVDAPSLVRLVQGGLPYESFEQLVANTALPNNEMLRLVSIPQRTLTRRKQEGRFHQDESDRLVRISRIFARALELFEGHRDSAMHWLSQPQKALAEGIPMAMARTEVGALEVERLIGRLEHGVFT